MVSYKYKPDFWASICEKDYHEKGLMLYALTLKFEIVDVASLAADSLTDNRDDKGIDALYFDEETKTAVIIQGYMAIDERKPAAKASKAADFNAAIAWALAQPIEKVPATIRINVDDLRKAIKNDEVTQIEFWYVHNLDESENVKKELEAVEATAKAMLDSYFAGKNVSVRTLEVGNKTLESWYKSKTQTILVDEDIEANVVYGGYEISGHDWRAFDTSVSIKWVHELFRKYGNDLFSADIRGYLGSVQINNQIKDTCLNEPINFWVYNNGITCLVHAFDYREKDKKIRLKGISIINGAQTTGAIGSVSLSDDGYLPIRFITSDKSEIWHNMVLYNNSQNEIYSSDFRSNDEVQKRLREEFKSIPDTHYLGRRGGVEDARRRDPDLISTEKAAISLVAFHGDPSLTYHKRAEIWLDKYYSKYYNSDLSARHLVFTYSLSVAIESKKDELRKKFDELTGLKLEEYEFFKKRGGMRLYLSAIGQSMEEILNKKIPNLNKLAFGFISWREAVKNWEDVINKTVMHCDKLRPGIDNGILKDEYVRSSISEFKRTIAAQVAGDQSIYDAFQKKVKLD